MSIHQLETRKFKDGRIVLYKRSDHKNPCWQVRIRVPNSTGYKRKATGTTDEFEARRIAEDLYEEVYLNVKDGGVVNAPAYSKVVHDLIAHIEAREGEQKAKNYRTRLIPYSVKHFGRKRIDSISVEDLHEYEDWRIENAIRKEPSANTLRAEASAMQRVFNRALEKNYIRQQIIVPKPDHQNQRRPAFTREEYEAIKNVIPDFIDEFQHGRINRHRQMLCDYFIVLMESGIRAGEARTLQWRNVSNITHENGVKNVKLRVTGKTGDREAIPMPQAAKVLKDMKERRRIELEGNEVPNGEAVFCSIPGKAIGSFKKGFDSLVRFADLTKDSQGQKRTIYSLRHSYATFRLIEGVNQYLLAQNMGTSVEMIERFYGHVKPSDVADKLAGQTARDSGIKPPWFGHEELKLAKDSEPSTHLVIRELEQD